MIIFKEIKWMIQKLFRGYSDPDLWNLCDHLSKLILKRLKAFKNMPRHGYPVNISEEKWSIILDDIIFAFWYASKDFGFDCKEIWPETDFSRTTSENIEVIFSKKQKPNKELWKEYEERYNKGMDYFKDYFGGFWD